MDAKDRSKSFQLQDHENTLLSFSAFVSILRRCRAEAGPPETAGLAAAAVACRLHGDRARIRVSPRVTVIPRVRLSHGHGPGGPGRSLRIPGGRRVTDDDEPPDGATQ